MKKISFLLILSVLFIACKQTKEETPTYTHDFETVEGDPSNTLIYTLDNGLKVYLSVNKLEPRIQTLVAVKAGSKFDPAETTGLAHYLEHMMFKGTHQIGTKDWESEKAVLDEIAATFEAHKNEMTLRSKQLFMLKLIAFH